MPAQAHLQNRKCLKVADIEKVLGLKDPAGLCLPTVLLSQAYKTGALHLPCHVKDETWALSLSWMPAVVHLLKFKCLEVAPTEKVLALKALAGPHLPMALLREVHKDWGSALALPPQSSNIASGSLPDACRSPAQRV